MGDTHPGRKLAFPTYLITNQRSRPCSVAVHLRRFIVGDKLRRYVLFPLALLINREEVDLDLLHGIKDPSFTATLEELGVGLDDDFLRKEENQVLEDLAVEYCRLFLGHGPHLPPYKSVNVSSSDAKGLLWGDATVAVKSIYEECGLYVPSGYIPDHLGIELEFMSFLTYEEGKAWRENTKEGVLRYLNLEGQFLSDHLPRWVPEYCDKVSQAAEERFYEIIAEVTKEYILMESDQIPELIENAEKL